MTQATGETFRYALLGASRGLGQEFYQLVKGQPCLIVARSAEAKMDFSKEEHWSSYLLQLREFAPTHMIYFAGGGPYGSYGEKQWKDHQWAMKVSYEFPAYLLHDCLNSPWSNLKQISFIGSAIAEAKPDPRAASYSAAKHALVGLLKSVQKEEHGSLDLRLFSPAYMDTALLPKHAWPRQQGQIQSAKLVAQQLYQWLQKTNDANGHLVI